MVRTSNWFTDEDEIAPNQTKHAEATRFIGHLLNHYCTGNMGHFRFGTTASDFGDLLIEDLAAVPDLAAGGLGAILSRVGLPTNSRVPERLAIAADGIAPIKVRYMRKLAERIIDRPQEGECRYR